MLDHGKEIGVIFTALLMRPVDGFELIHQMHRFAPGCLVFAVTQTETWEFRKLAWLKGVNGLLVRPGTDTAIRAALQVFEL